MEICLSAATTFVDSSSLIASPQHVCSDERAASWQDPLTRLRLSVTLQSEQPEAPTTLQDQQWRRMRKKTFQLRAGVQCARIVAHHCIHPSRV